MSEAISGVAAARHHRPAFRFAHAGYPARSQAITSAALLSGGNTG